LSKSAFHFLTFSQQFSGASPHFIVVDKTLEYVYSV